MKNRILHLDGLRGLAILLVVVFHVYARWPSYLEFVNVTKDFPLFKYGYYGVQLFFMISGFVIFMSLDNSKSALEFVRKRWLRLFPTMFLVSMLIYSTANLFYERPAGEPSAYDLLPGLVFIHPSIVSKLIGSSVSSLEGAFWSLYIEVFFYFISCLLYFSLGRSRLMMFIFSIFITTSVLNLLSYDVSILLSLGFGYYGWFFIGCFTYEKINGRVSFVDHVALIISVILCLKFDSENIESLSILIFIIVLFFFSFYIEFLSGFLTNKLLLFFGFISYPLYLMHENMMISTIMKVLYVIELEGWISYIIPIIPLALISLVSWFIALKVEPLLRNLINIFFLKNIDSFVIRVRNYKSTLKL